MVKDVSQLTLNQLIRFQLIEKSQLDNFEKSLRLLTIVTGQKYTEIESLPLKQLNKLLIKLSFIRATTPSKKLFKTIWLKGKRYKLIKDEFEMNANQYTMIKNLQENTIENYNRLAAIVYLRSPLFKKSFYDSEGQKEFSEQILKMPVKKVFGALFFYSKQSEIWKQTLEQSLASQHQVIQSHMIEIYNHLEALGKSTDGTLSSMKSQAETLLKKTN